MLQVAWQKDLKLPSQQVVASMLVMILRRLPFGTQYSFEGRPNGNLDREGCRVILNGGNAIDLERFVKKPPVARLSDKW